MSNPDTRWRQRLHNFRKAFSHLIKATNLAAERELSELERQGIIQGFEYTHELAWNTLKDFLESRGVTALYESRDVTREAFAKGLIEQGSLWMEMITSRNQTSHGYNMETADSIVEAITARYVAEFDALLLRLGALEGEDS